MSHLLSLSLGRGRAKGAEVLGGQAVKKSTNRHRAADRGGKLLVGRSSCTGCPGPARFCAFIPPSVVAGAGRAVGPAARLVAELGPPALDELGKFVPHGVFHS